jgi:hypothetical protein
MIAELEIQSVKGDQYKDLACFRTKHETYSFSPRFSARVRFREDKNA